MADHPENDVAERLTAALTALLGDRPLCSVTVKYYGWRQGQHWTACTEVKPAPKRDREAWADGATPDEALLRLLVAVESMASGARPVRGGDVTEEVTSRG